MKANEENIKDILELYYLHHCNNEVAKSNNDVEEILVQRGYARALNDVIQVLVLKYNEPVEHEDFTTRPDLEVKD